MSTTETRSHDPATGARVGQVDMKLEVITLPVSNFDRAKEFYGSLGWRLDADFRHDGERAIQFTPPGSQCSIHFAANGTPGSAQGLFLVVSDIQAARDRPGRQRLAAAGSHDAAPRPGGRRYDVRVGGGSVAGAAARGGRARSADGRTGRELARLVRRVHGA